jgi:type VI secretion system secreted protein Hcp
MNRKYSIAPALAIVGLLALVATQPAGAAVFIKFDGVDGEATDKDHKDWIEVLSLSARMDLNPMALSAGSAQPRADITHDDFILTKTVDKASAKLTEAVCNGKVFPKVEIEMTSTYEGSEGSGGSRATFLKYELKNVMVTSYSVSGASNSGERAMEEIALNFEEVKVTYTENDSKGASKGEIETSHKVGKGEK